MRKSQFAALFKTDGEERMEIAPKGKVPKTKPPRNKPSASSTSADEVPPETGREKRVGGKSSSSDYTQVLSYLNKDTHNRVKAALIFDEQRRDLSDLVEELLSTWLDKEN